MGSNILPSPHECTIVTRRQLGAKTEFGQSLCFDTPLTSRYK
jgi:hypothetical protein